MASSRRPDHSLDWGIVDDELHTFFNDQTRTLDATLYGRRLYEVMAAYWPTGEADPASTDRCASSRASGIRCPRSSSRRASSTSSHNSRLVRGDVGPVFEGIRREFDGDLGVAGPNLAGQFVRRGLVDEYRLVVHPVVLGQVSRSGPSSTRRCGSASWISTRLRPASSSGRTSLRRAADAFHVA